MPVLKRLKKWLTRSKKKEGLYARIEGPALLEHEARETILHVLKRDPGLSFQEVQDHVGLAPGTTKWHLDKLQRSRFLGSTRDGRHTRYYPTGLDPKTVRAIVALRDPSRLALVRMVMRNPGISQGDLAHATGLAQSTVSHHLSRLCEDRLVRKERDGRTARYYVLDAMEKPVHQAVGYVM